MTACRTQLEHRHLAPPLCGVVVVAGFLALWPLQRSIDQQLSAGREASEVLYLASGKLLRRLSLGHEGLLADVYWTRVVQYFGRRRLAHATRFDLLGPLLQITTELDPQLPIAYRYGSVFLAEKPPGGAGQPQQALALLRRGIVANPDYWRLWQDLGFIYYWDLKDYPNAAKAFLVGSKRPGAMLWMKVLATSVAAKGGAIETSRLLWLEIARQAGTTQLRRSAEEHLAALHAAEQIQQLDAILGRYEEKAGRPAHSFGELIAAGYLAAVPKDPSGVPYAIGPDGRTGLGRESRIDLRLLQ